MTLIKLKCHKNVYLINNINFGVENIQTLNTGLLIDIGRCSHNANLYTNGTC